MNAKLRNAQLQDANLGEAILYGADFERADLRGANLMGVEMMEFGKTFDLRAVDVSFRSTRFVNATIDEKTVLPFDAHEAASRKMSGLAKAPTKNKKIIKATPIQIGP